MRTNKNLLTQYYCENIVCVILLKMINSCLLFHISIENNRRQALKNFEQENIFL